MSNRLLILPFVLSLLIPAAGFAAEGPGRAAIASAHEAATAAGIPVRLIPLLGNA